MVQGVLTQLLSEIKVNVKLESGLGDASNLPEADTTNIEAKLRLEREEYNIQHAFGQLQPQQKIELMCKRAGEPIRQDEYQPSQVYTQTIRSKFILIFAIFTISAKQQQASLSKDFFKQLNDYLQNCAPVEKRLQMGFDFAFSFQLQNLTAMNEDDKLNLLTKMYDLLKQQDEGSLFGHDKFSFIIDHNLNKASVWLQGLIEAMPQFRSICLKILMQLGRVRNNPADYLACIVARQDDKILCVDLNSEMTHIYQDLHLSDSNESQIQNQQVQSNAQVVLQSQQKKFTEKHSLNRGILYYYKAGEHKIDITSQDQFVTDGIVLYHFKRGKGLYKLGIGDGITKISGNIKQYNISDSVKSMEPSAMFILDHKLYIRDYCQSPCPFQVFDGETLEIDSETSEKWKQHFDQLLKKNEIPPIVSINAQPDESVQEIQIHRSLLWHKDSKSGRTLEIAPIFTDGSLVYCISFQKQIASDKPQMLVLETYDPKNDFAFVRFQILFQNDDCDPFIYDSNSLNFLRSSQWMTNGTILVLNVPNINVFFFDIQTGKKIGQEKSEHILMTYSPQKNKFYTIRSLPGPNQVLFEVAFDNLYPHSSHEVLSEETFIQVEEKFIHSLKNLSGHTELQSTELKVETIMEKIVFGDQERTSKNELALISTTEEQIKAQHTIILRYLDLKREQAKEVLPTSEFIKVFKCANVTYLTGATFSLLIQAATKLSSSPYDLLYVLRLLQCNFTALIMCQGSLPIIMREHQNEYESFFILYNSVLRNKVYEQPNSLVEKEIQSVCIEIMASSINILYKSNQDIIEKFLSELKENPNGINCSIFFDYFSQAENCEKLLSKEISGGNTTQSIFKETCQIQLKYTLRQLKSRDSSSPAEVSACKFLKVYSQRILTAFCDQLQKIADRPPQIQKLPHHLLEKYAEEDAKLANLQTEVMTIYESLSDSLVECLKQIEISTLPTDKKLLASEVARIRSLLLQKSPFAQLHVCLYSTVFTALNVDTQLLPLITEKSLKVISTIQQIYQNIQSSDKFDQQVNYTQNGQIFHWLGKIQRSLAYLISIQGYRLVKAESKKEEQNSVEQQIIQTSLLSGGIDQCFEKEFSKQTLDQASQYQKIWQSQVKLDQDQSDYKTLHDIIENVPGSDVAKAIKILQDDCFKKIKSFAVIGGQNGLKLSLCAFAAILKLQDQTSIFLTLVDYQDLQLMEPSEVNLLTSLYTLATKSMRSWTHEVKNSLSEKINQEVDQKFRKEKQDRIDKAALTKNTEVEIIKVESAEVQIDTTTSQTAEQKVQSFFTEEEEQLLRQEQEKIFEIELQKLYDSVTEKANYLIKLQPPLVKLRKINSKSSSSQQTNELLQSWKQMQKDQGAMRTNSLKQQELMQAWSNEVITVLKMPCEVSRIMKQVEDIYVAAHRRVAGLDILERVIYLCSDSWSRSTFIDCIQWMCAALRNNQNQQVHYQDTLKGCGRYLEEQLRDKFFKILSYIVKQLGSQNNDDAEIQLFINALKWRFSGRDHESLGQLRLFETLHKSQKLQLHWGKPISTDFEFNQNKPLLKFKFTVNSTIKAELQQLFDNQDTNRNGKLNYEECKSLYKQLCEKFNESWDSMSRFYDETWNKVQEGEKVTFEILFREIQYKVKKSVIGKQILSLFDQLFSSSVNRLIESDIGVMLKFQNSSQLTRAKSIINQNSSEVLLGEMFEVIFAELNRYLKILKAKPGIDWPIYAQQRTNLQDLLLKSVDEYTLLDQPKLQNPEEQHPAELFKITSDESNKDETEEQRNLRHIQAEIKKQEDRANQEISQVSRLYSESFLARILRLLELFTSVSACQPNLLAMVQRIASPNQLTTLFDLLIQSSPKIKYLVIRILNSLIVMKLPMELFEEAISIQLADSESIITQLFRKVQPTLKFSSSKFLAFLHQYVLSIRQKVWVKSSVESEGQYEISCELLRLMRCIYESQESEQHPWRSEINQIINQLFSEMKRLNRPRDVEVILSFIRGSDYKAISQYSSVLQGKDKLSIVGFVNHEWLKRQTGTSQIEDCMKREDLAVLVVESGKDVKDCLKLVPPSKLRVFENDSDNKNQFTLTSELIKKLLANLNLKESDQSAEDVQNLDNKCMVLKLVNEQLEQNSNKFLSALRESGQYEQLLRFVCKESSLEIKGKIIPIQWLEQSVFNIRKHACENQKSLLKTQETQIRLIGEKLYAAVLNPNSDSDKQYLRAKLLTAFNHKGFAQRKDIKLVNGSDIFYSIEEETKVEQQVALLEPHEFTDGNGLQLLNRSQAVITCEADLYQIVAVIRQKNGTDQMVEDFEQKTIFVVTREDYDMLQGMCTGQARNKSQNNEQQEKKTLDQEFSDSLVKYGGLTRQVANKTKSVVGGVEQKSKYLFELLKQIKDGSIQITEEEEAIQVNNDSVNSSVIAECQIENQTVLGSHFREQNSERQDQENEGPTNPIEGRFWSDTKVDESSDLPTLYEEKIKRLFNMYCRNIFWSLIQKDKIESMFDFLLTTPQDIKAFVTFVKVIGNESFITNNQDNIKKFKTFIKQVVKVSLADQKFQSLLQILINDLIDSYRKQLSKLLQSMSSIQVVFMTENQASELMNPFIVFSLLKYLINLGGFNLLKERIDELLSILLVINTTFDGDNNLKDKQWHQIIKILDYCQNLPTKKVEQICRLPIIEVLFNDIEQQNSEESQELSIIQTYFNKGKDFDSSNIFKLVFEHKQRITQRFLTFSTKRTFQLIQIEVLYKFFKLSQQVPECQFFFNNNLNAFIQMHGRLISEGVEGALSKHLLFLHSLTPELRIVKNEIVADLSSSQVIEISNQSADKIYIRVKQSSLIKPFQRVAVSTDREGLNQISSFSQKDIEQGYGLACAYTPKVFLQVVQPLQNYIVDLSTATISVDSLPVRVENHIIQKSDQRIETKMGIFRMREGESISKRICIPIKDHLKFKQVNFGKECVIALLPNGNVIGWGQSKHRHFVDRQSYEGNKDDDIIPLVLKPLQSTDPQQTPAEKLAHREIVQIRTFKRTTVCLTAAGVIYACGDKFAKLIKRQTQNALPFGFYQLPIDLSPVQIKKPIQEEKQVSQPVEELESVSLESLFRIEESEVAKPLEIIEEEVKADQSFKSAESGDDDFKSSKSQQDETQQSESPQKTLSHSAPVTNLIEEANKQEEFTSAKDESEIQEAIKAQDIKLELEDQPVAQESESAIEKAEIIQIMDESAIQIEENNQIQNQNSQQIVGDDESDYVPKPDQVIEEQQLQPTQENQSPVVLQAPKAEQVWISKTSSSKSIVILGLFKTSEGKYEFRTIGVNSFGLLGQGKDVKESHGFRVIDFGVALNQIDQVVVGQNHFIVRADGKVFAWGCYNTESEERMVWKPSELQFFSQHKIKSIQSGNMFTVALVEQIGAPDHFVYGKFVPLWNENTYKSLKEFSQNSLTINQEFIVDGQNLIVCVNSQKEIDLKDVKIELETVQDYGFQTNSKIYEGQNSEAYKKFEELLTLPESVTAAQRAELIKQLQVYVFTRVKDNQFDDITWKDIGVDELKISDSLGLSEGQKRQWLLLIVNYCKNIWGHFTYIGGKIVKHEGMQIIENFIKNRQNVLMCLKNKLLRNILQSLPKDGSEMKELIAIHIPRLKAEELKQQGQIDSKYQWSVFSKVSEALRKAGYQGMRQNTQQMRAWFAKFIGEGANDDGGLFRESITALCLELQSKVIDLFLPVGNQTNKIGENRDCWIVNPKATSKIHLRKFHFIGCLFGMCVRSGVLINLNLAPMFWKRLTGDPLTSRDIMAIDSSFMNNLEAYKNFKAEGKSEEEFISTFQLNMQCLNSAMEMIDLVEQGAKVPVTYSNLQTYIDGCIRVRLNESKEQYQSIIKGFDTIFRSSYLKMISWNDLEMKVVGNEEIDIDRLKEMTQYKGCNANHDVVKRFWKVLAAFDNDDKKRYLRFVWGRTRLPPKEETDIEQHTVQLDENKKKTDLPFGRTCYFRIELPPYDREDILRERLLTVFKHCDTIDGDFERAATSEPTSQQNQQREQDASEHTDQSDDEELRADRERVERAAAEAARRNERQGDYDDEEEE